MIEATSFWDLVERRAARSPDALLAVDESDRRLTCAEYRMRCAGCAAALHAGGLRPGSRVSWTLPTSLESAILIGALARLAVRQNPILPIHRHREVGYITRQSRADLLIVPRMFRGFDHAAMARDVAAAHAGLDVLVLDGALPGADAAGLPPAPAGTTGTLPVRWLFYTSGTTADPKGALHTDATMLAFSLGMARALELRADDRIAMVFPITHIGGVGWLMAALMSGAALIVVATFDPQTSADVLARHGVTQATAGTVFHQSYLATQRARGAGRLFPDVRAFPGGGAPKPPQLHHDIKREMGGAGIVSGYGLTECPVATMNTVQDSDDRLARTEGRPNPPEMQIRIVKADGSLARTAEEGEVRVRGPQLFAGYLDAALDDAAFDEDGYFRTGDLGTLDADGFLAITGRLKDVIIRNGETISAREVEDLLHQHGKVAEAAIVGVPDARTGERCCAVVVSRDPADPLRFDEMVAFLRDRQLAMQKLPEQLESVDVLPRNATGKVRKDELRRRLGAASG